MTRRKSSAPIPLQRSRCSIANTLDVVGDKWSLLVVRDLMRGKKTYGELAASPEGIPTNLLADRLKRLEDAGIIKATVYQERPVRRAYTLTRKGDDLREIMLAIVAWGKKHIPGTMTVSELSAPASRPTAHRVSRKRQRR